MEPLVCEEMMEQVFLTLFLLLLLLWVRKTPILKKKVRLIHAVPLKISATDRLLLFLYAIKFASTCFYKTTNKNIISLEYISTLSFQLFNMSHFQPKQKSRYTNFLYKLTKNKTLTKLYNSVYITQHVSLNFVRIQGSHSVQTFHLQY